MAEKGLEILFDPLVMNNLTVKNRFFMAPMGTSFDLDQLANYLVARAKGGVGLITSGLMSVHPSGRAKGIGQLVLETDKDIDRYLPMVKAVKAAGSRFIAQLGHVGRYAFSRVIGQPAVAPSPIASFYTRETPRALSTDEVDEMVLSFAEAAVRAQKAGFDGVEICANSGYLISQFLSASTNKREDKYGGSLLDRARFLFSIIGETRKRVGDDFNICVKFDAEDGVEGGNTLEDSLILAPKMVEAGADRLHVWAGWHESLRPMLPSFVPRGAFSYLSAAIKEVVDVPVSTVGRINDPYVAAGILRRKEADLIGLGRQMLCDPDFVRKIEEGRIREIRRCIACCYCIDQTFGALKSDKKVELKCALNPELGHEGKALADLPEKKRKVVVAGSGPAGLEAARTAARRGHDVTLYEKEERLGGLLNLAVVPPHKEELKNILDYYSLQMELCNVKLKLNESFTIETLEKIKPDVLVVAVGAEPIVPNIPGIEGDHVVTSLDVLEGRVQAGENVVVIGGGLVGLETAEYLADGGARVTICEMLKSVARDVERASRWGMVSRISKKMRVLTSTKVIGIQESEVVVESVENGRETIPADTVVVAVGFTARTDLLEALNQSDIERYTVGSCGKPGKIADAVAEGFSVGCRIR